MDMQDVADAQCRILKALAERGPLTADQLTQFARPHRGAVKKLAVSSAIAAGLMLGEKIENGRRGRNVTLYRLVGTRAK